MQANATNFQLNSIFDSIRHNGSKIIKQLNKQHKHQSISELEFQIHNFDIYTENHVLMPNHNKYSYLILVLTQSNGNI